MKLRYQAEFYDGTTEDIIVSPMAIIGWERHSGKTMASMGESVTMEDMTWLAWEQARLRGTTDRTFDEWAMTLADLDVVDETTPTPGGEAA